MGIPVFRWLFSTLRVELTKPEVGSYYRTPWPGVSFDTVRIHRNMHTCPGRFDTTHAYTHKKKQTEPAYLSQLAHSSRLLFCSRLVVYCTTFSFSLSVSSLISRSVWVLFTLGFPDMISMKFCSSDHALPVLPGTFFCLSWSHKEAQSGL